MSGRPQKPKFPFSMDSWAAMAAWVQEQCVYAPETGCMLWSGYSGPKDRPLEKQYGRVMFAGSLYAVHRLMWEAYNGRSAGEAFVLHACGNARCAEPTHLSLGTHAENMAQARGLPRLRHGMSKHRGAKKKKGLTL